MALSQNSAFKPCGQVLFIPREVGDQWKKLGIVFCENNGSDWQGSCYILEPEEFQFDIDKLRFDLAQRGINLDDFTSYRNGYWTEHFGFDDLAEPDSDYPEIDEKIFTLCENVLSEMGIYWCGWIDTPTFTLCAEEPQILELEEHLKEPIARWREENGFSLL